MLRGRCFEMLRGGVLWGTDRLVFGMLQGAERWGVAGC